MTAPELGVFARVFPVGTAAEVAAQISEAGFTTTQLNLKVLGVPTLPDPAGWDQVDAHAVRDAFAGAGVSVWGLSATYNMCHPDPAVRREGTRRATETIARAAQFGAGFVTLCTGSRDAEHMWAEHPDNRLPDAWRDFRAELDVLLDTAQRSHVRLGIEPETGLVVDDSRSMRRLLGELGPGAEHLGVVLDGANLIVGVDRDPAEVLREAFSELGPHIACVHAKDSRGGTRPWRARVRWISGSSAGCAPSTPRPRPSSCRTSTPAVRGSRDATSRTRWATRPTANRAISARRAWSRTSSDRRGSSGDRTR